MPVDRHRTLQLQDVARGEVDEDQSGARVAQKVAQGVVEAVAAEVGDGERVALHADEARPAAAMRHVEPALGAHLGPRAAGDEERIGRGDQRPRRLVESAELLARGLRHGARRGPARLDVLRAIAEALGDPHGEAVIDRDQAAVGAVAPAAGEVEPDQADLRSRDEARSGGIVCRRQRTDAQRGGIGRLHEARRAAQHRGHRPAALVERGGEQIAAAGRRRRGAGRA